MKQIAILLISCLTFSANAQLNELQGKVGDVSVNSQTKKAQKVDLNTPLSVIDLDSHVSDRPPAYFIQGKHSTETLIHSIDLQQIDSLTIEKKDITIKGKEYYGQINIKLKTDYKPRLISLADLKKKHTKLKDRPTVILIDDHIVKNDYNTSLVDENYILKIEVQTLANKRENLDVSVMRLITKTEENMRKASEIRLRGDATTMLN